MWGSVGGVGGCGFVGVSAKPTGAKENVEPQEAGVISGCVPPVMGGGNPTQVLCRDSKPSLHPQEAF